MNSAILFREDSWEKEKRPVREIAEIARAMVGKRVTDIWMP